MSTDAQLDSLAGDARIVQEAKDRFKRCQDWEDTARVRFLEDLKFADADSDNGYQWPAPVMQDRGTRPSLTINIIRQHNLQIINEAKKNKPSVKIRPTGNGATFDSAQVLEGIVRHIEYISNAQVAYDTATSFQVKAGIGWWRVVTDYAHDNTFDQEIFIRRIPDALSVMLDRDIKEKDGSDARYGFVFEDMPKDVYQADHPDDMDVIGQTPLGSDSDGWVSKDHVRVAEYYRCVTKKDKLVLLTDPKTGEQTLVKKSTVPAEILNQIPKSERKERAIKEYSVEWYKIAGNKIIDRKNWPGMYIPLVRLIGEETVIEGELDRKGHTRAMKDAQRMYNYNASGSVEYGALQGKNPYIAPAAAIEGYETYWATANTQNWAVLPYNHIDDAGNPIPAPERTTPPQSAPIYIEGMNIAERQMMIASGQYEASLGQKSNEISGKAIDARDRQGDDATYHFIDNLGIAIRFTGKILIDLIPKIYDTARIVKILADDGKETEVQVQPKLKTAYEKVDQESVENKVIAIFNPNVGKYEVEADIGPAYATRRQETFNAVSIILRESPELMTIIGDLMFQAADFPGADEIAKRLSRMVPAQAKGDGIPPEQMELQAQLEKSQGMITELLQELASQKLKLQQKDNKKEVDDYNAITSRMKVIADHYQVTPVVFASMLHDMMMEEHKANLQPKEPVSESTAA